MGRIGDAVRTLFLPSWDADLKAKYAEIDEHLAEARQAVVEMNNALEKLNTWAAREAKRQSRSAQLHLATITNGDQPPPAAAAAVAPGPDLMPGETRAQWKARLRRTVTHESE